MNNIKTNYLLAKSDEKKIIGYAQFKTKSNFRNLNDELLAVIEVAGSRITTIVPMEGRIDTYDFTMNECKSLTIL